MWYTWCLNTYLGRIFSMAKFLPACKRNYPDPNITNWHGLILLKLSNQNITDTHWLRISDISGVSVQNAKGTTGKHPPSHSLFNLATNTEISVAEPPDDRAAFFLRLSDSWTHPLYVTWNNNLLSWLLLLRFTFFIIIIMAVESST